MSTRPNPSADFTDYPTSALAMAFKGFVFFLFACFFDMGSTTYCTSDSDCSGFGESCCSDSVCRQTCYYCSYDYQCGTGEECCDGDCLSMCPITLATLPTYTSSSVGAIAGAVVGTIIFLSVIIAIASCLCCACCPYYHYRSPGTVIVSGQPRCQQMVSTTHTTQQALVQYPLAANYPPQPTGFMQPPPPYSSYPPAPTQYPPPQPPIATGQPLKY